MTGKGSIPSHRTTKGQKLLQRPNRRKRGRIVGATVVFGSLISGVVKGSNDLAKGLVVCFGILEYFPIIVRVISIMTTHGFRQYILKGDLKTSNLLERSLT